MRLAQNNFSVVQNSIFPFLFGGTFIEATLLAAPSMRDALFPFLFGGTFIEAFTVEEAEAVLMIEFPFLFGGTFIEAWTVWAWVVTLVRFPFLFGGTFIEATRGTATTKKTSISLPFRRDFH